MEQLHIIPSESIEISMQIKVGVSFLQISFAFESFRGLGY